MSTRTATPQGAPCWVDLWTSDVEGSRRFYAGLFGWEAGEPSPEFGGYFMFLRNGVPVAGAMGDMGDLAANDTWKPYLSVADIEETLRKAVAAGGTVLAPAMPVADLGIQAVLADPAGATIGAWQAGTFLGFGVLEEDGSPAWFEVLTTGFDGAVAFYEQAFDWTTRPLPGEHSMRYVTLHDDAGDQELAGIMDASTFLSPGTTPAWTVYWQVASVDESLDKLAALGGTVLEPAVDTPFGRMAAAADPAGARFKLRS